MLAGGIARILAGINTASAQPQQAAKICAVLLADVSYFTLAASKRA